MPELKVINRSSNPLPAYQTPGSAGMDVHADLSEAVAIEPGARVLIPTGLFLELPEGYEAQLRPRSGLAFREGITLPNAPATIDSDYRGEVKVALINLSEQTRLISPGDRIAQMVIARYEKVQWKEVKELGESRRGEGGFGHTGVSVHT